MALRPFTTLVYDIVFVTPSGRGGEIGCLSAICVYTKYVWLRTLTGRGARDVAWALFAVICGSGVAPLRLLSDRDSAFRDQVVLELSALFRAK